MRRFALLCLCAIALSSCVGIDSTLTIRRDGSGSLAMVYRISRSLADLGKTGDAVRAVPLPVERSDFEDALAAAPGVRLQRYSRSDGEKEVTVRAELAFDSVSDLAGLAPLADTGLTLSSSGGRFTLTETLYRAGPQKPDAHTQTMIDNLFQGYDVSLAVTAPAPIVEHSIGTLSADQRTLTWRATVPDLVRAGADVVLTASW